MIKLTSICFYLLTGILFILAILSALFLDSNWLAYSVTIVLFAGIIYLKRFKKLKPFWLQLTATLLFFGVSLITITLTRPNLTVSLYGNLVNNSLKMANHMYEAKHGISLFVKKIETESKPYRAKDWQSPAGYTNKTINLGKARGYMLSANKGKHTKVIYQIHGGGYLAQFSNTYNKAAVNYSNADNQANVFSLDYRTAPKHPFPAALNDALTGYQYLLKHGYQAKNIIIAGDSSGAGLSLALTLYLRDHKDPLPAALVLASPWADLTASGKSYRTNITKDPLFGSASSKKSPRHPIPITYAGKHNLKNPYISPVFGNFKDFPPMLIQTGSNELLLSDSKTIVKKARAAKVHVKFLEFSGMYHIFYISTPQIPEGQRAWANIRSFVSKY
ncbi:MULTISPECIES: alpha/beta hydrolase fold domain-containing protein [Lacticaseibacillus]|uniref:Alpha/beta hydrolase n=2 Tax=Lacticaseibacillus TaxID=2759736 RepID=A0AAN1EXJ7_LACCA|nr:MULTISPECIES: alpha/beta hydrolase fold domain-containing protein [Lacticaseibacillus]ARY90271.1 alpha/beta hydrolase [Lacticaseibacillus casei]KAB1969985.1 alpha/beta hydrolase [Lacticaseibacillus casei]WLV80886.1 alpha/beta hydrolase fold domain-containing protein [Lacticaseibacillus sp. NCIMB 15473]WNX24846.1 alpha/beta hydrolase fold domain-containing protein [Lacticaseibacillus casei]WNX27618.1 alpha/beta hydrolase fold domain-containing protein [Lacticaseibacillus casei]